MEEKAQYFAQYWGQNINVYSGLPQFTVEIDTFILDSDLSDQHLLLTPLSAITDEDAVEVARLYWYNNAKLGDIAHTKRVIDTLIQKTYVADYLRSKGYAIDWRNYSVEQLIELGWLKLKP